MKDRGRGVVEGRSRFGVGKLLVIAQVALSLVLLVGAGLLLETFTKLATLDPGFEPGHILVVHLDLRNAHYPKDRLLAASEDMLERVRMIPGVRSASSSNNTPVSDVTQSNTIKVDRFVAKSERDATIYLFNVSPRFFETLGTPILAGRDVDRRDAAGSAPVAMINEAMAKKFFGGASPLGKYLRSTFPPDAKPVEVIGVVGDAKYSSLRDKPVPIAYFAARQENSQYPFATFEVRGAGSAADLIPGVKAALEEVNPDITLFFHTMAAQLSASLARERMLATLSGFFGGLALLLATIGLYGVMSYNIARRRNEIGIRMALGAAQARVLRMVLGEVALVVVIGLAAGLCAALGAARLVASFLYGLKPTDPATLAIAAAVLTAVATVAGYLPARRASRLDPMEALREE